MLFFHFTGQPLAPAGISNARSYVFLLIFTLFPVELIRKALFRKETGKNLVIQTAKSAILLMQRPSGVPAKSDVLISRSVGALAKRDETIGGIFLSAA